MEINKYQCPNCAGTVNFDSGVQKMKCPFCDSEFEIAALEEYQKEAQTYAEGDNFGWESGACKNHTEELEISEENDLASGSCPSCGAELYGDKNTIATVCPCCGNAQIMAKRITGILKPDFVIPFKLKRAAAIEALKSFCEGKRLLPNDYFETKRIRDMRGVYVPFWLFDTRAHGHVRYKATKRKVRSDGNNTYITTSHYSVIRDGTMAFEAIPVDASEKMDDAYMDAIEPFDYSQKVEFNRSYLAGYLAEKYDVDAERSKPRVERRLRGSVETEFKNSVYGYHTVRAESTVVWMSDVSVKYSLFPVWVFNSRYQDENYQFMMNGQTGRLAGRLPVDNGKVWKFRSMFTGLFGAVLTPVMYVLDTSYGTFEMIADIAVSVVGLELGADFDIPVWMVTAGAWTLAGTFAELIVRRWKRQMDTTGLQSNATEYAVSFPEYTVKSDTFLYTTTVKIPKPKRRR